VNFTEWTDIVEELWGLREVARQRHWCTEELRHRASYEYPQDSTVMEFISRAEEESRKNYEARNSAYEAVLQAGFNSEQTERQPENATSSSVTESTIPAPMYPFQFTTWNNGKRMRHVIRRNLQMWTEIHAIVDAGFAIDETRAKSWREEIVDEAVMDDAS
jgi:hypothetical protein